MKKKATLATALIVGYLVTFAGFCQESNYRKVVRLTDDVAHGIESAVDLTEILYDQKDLSASDTTAIANELLKDSRIVKQAKTQLEAYKNLKGQDQVNSRLILEGTLKSLVDSIDTLINDGSLHIKSQKSQQAFTTAVGAVKSTLLTIDALVKGGN